MMYAQFVLAATWFIGIWIIWYCNLRINEIYFVLYVFITLESDFAMRPIYDFAVFKAEVFCQLLKESTRQILKSNLRIFRRLNSYEIKRAVGGIYDKQIVVRKRDTSLGRNSLYTLKSSSLAILSGMAIIRSTIRQMLYRSLGIPENTSG